MVINDLIIYLLPLVFSCFLSLILTPLIIKLTFKIGILDLPDPLKVRKIHVAPTPLLGGVAIYSSFVISLGLAYFFGWLNDGVIKNSQIIGLLLGGLILIIGGYYDDRYHLPPSKSFIFPVLATLTVIISGVAVKYITNPFLAGSGPYGRALFYFEWVDLKVFSFGAFFSFLWILGMIYTTKFLDGLDGLVAGIGAIGAVILFFVSLFWDVPLSATSVLCLILVGSLLGFLRYNFHPARIFLGEGGGTFIGFMLGVLAIISGGKIATALLIMGLPILDVVWVVMRRLLKGQHVYQADRKHLHFRLLDAGFSHKHAVLFLYVLTLIFGSSTLFLQSQYKVWAFLFVVVITIILAYWLIYRFKKNNY